VIRWWFLALLVTGTLLLQYVPMAFAGCEAGASDMGHSAIAFCCNGGDRAGNGPDHSSGHDTHGTARRITR